MSEEKPRAVIYARYSSHSQNEQSIDGQLRDNYAFAEAEGYQVIKEYIDRAQTGTSDDRASFQRMIKDAESRQFSIVIVWKLDRFARNRYDSATYKARLKKHGVRVVSAMERISDSPEGIILEGMLESMAEYYSANLSENIRRGIRESRLKGKYVCGSVPFGYAKAADGKIIIDPIRGQIMQTVFKRYADGDRMKDIVDDLNARGVRTNRGGQITPTTFTRALKNRMYVGSVPDEAAGIAYSYPALIDQETFDRVQAIIERHKHAPAAAKAKECYILSGKLYCGYCGSHMIGETGTSKTGAAYHYYKCRGNKIFKKCSKKPEPREQIEGYVFSKTMQYILADGQKERIAELIVAYVEADPGRSEADQLETQLNQIRRKADALLETLAEAPKAVRPQIMAKLEEYTQQQETIAAEISRLRVADGIRMTKQSIVAWLDDFCAGDEKDPEHRQRIIDLLVNSIYLYEDSIIVLFNITSVQELAMPSPSGDIEKYSGDFRGIKQKTPEISPECACSDFDVNGGLDAVKSELSHLYGFRGHVFGIHLVRACG